MKEKPKIIKRNFFPEKHVEISECNHPDFKYEYKCNEGKFYFYNEDKNIEFKCILPIHGNLTFYSDRDIKKLKSKIENGRIKSEKDDTIFMESPGVLKDFRILNPKKDKHVIKRKIEFSKKEIRYQYRSNGNIEFHRRNQMQSVATLQIPTVHDGKGNFAEVKQRMVHKKDSVYHVVTIDPSFFYNHTLIYFDDPFTITTDEQWDSGTKYRMESHTDFPNYLGDKGVGYGKLADRYGDYYTEDFSNLGWAATLNGYNGWVASVNDGSTAITHNWPGLGYANYNSSIKWASTWTGDGAERAQAYRQIAAWASDDNLEAGQFFFYWKCNTFNNPPNDFEIATWDDTDVPDAGNECARIKFGEDKKIYYWDSTAGPAAYIDSGKVYKEDTWYRIRITHDSDAPNGTYKAYILGGAWSSEAEICVATKYVDQVAAEPSYIEFDRTHPTANNPAQYYVDLVKVGDYNTSGNWETPTIEIEPQYRMYDTTISYEDTDGSNYITKIEWIINSVVVADYTTNISDTDLSPFTIEDADLTYGTFKDVESDFSIKVYTIGGHATTPVLTALSGTFEYIGYETTSTTQWDGGTKSGTETFTDFTDNVSDDDFGVPEDEIHLEWGSFFSDNFEGTVGDDVGTADYGDSDWDQTPGLSTIKIADDQYNSGEMSCKWNVPPGNGHAILDYLNNGIWTETGTIYHATFFWQCSSEAARTPNQFEIIFCDLFPVGNYIAAIRFTEALDIHYRDEDSNYVDTTKNYAEDTWYRIRFEFDTAGDTWSAWILGGAFATETLLIANEPYDAGSGTPGANIRFWRTTTDFGVDQAAYWIDNFKLGQYQASGTWKSPTYEAEEGKYVKNGTITYYDCDANNYISNIAWYRDSDDVKQAEYITNITDDALSPLTINNEDLTFGSFTDIDEDFYVIITLENTNTPAITTPKLQSFGGQFTHTAQQGQIDCEVRFTGNYPQTDWLGTWENRHKIKVNRTVIDEDLEDFPILLKLSPMSGIDNISMKDVFDEVGANSRRIAITLADGKTQCYAEVADWDATNEEARIWVGIPRIREHFTDYIYLYFDNSQSNNTDYIGLVATEVARKVWNKNYVFVSHMDDNPDTSHIRDSSKYSQPDPAKKGANEPIETTSNNYGLCQDFDGTDDRIEIAHHATLNLPDRVTVETWINFDEEPLDNTTSILTKGVIGGADYNYALYVRAPVDKLRFYAGVGNNAEIATPADMIGNWYYFAGTFDKDLASNQINVYLNEVVGTPATKTSPTETNTDVVTLGNQQASGGTLDFDGQMDEVRISNIARSPAWMKASYYSDADELLHYYPKEVYNIALHYKESMGYQTPFKTTLSSARNSLNTDDIWIESLQINHVANKTSQCDLRLTATEQAKLIERGDTIEVIREGDVYPFYGKVETISQSTGTHSINFHCEGMLFFCGKIPIRSKYYYITDFQDHAPYAFDADAQITDDMSGDNVNLPMLSVQALHTTEKNFGNYRDTDAPSVPSLDLSNVISWPNAMAMEFVAHGGSPSGKVNKICVRWKRTADPNHMGQVRFVICPDDGSGEPDTGSEIAYLVIADVADGGGAGTILSFDAFGCADDNTYDDIVFDYSDFTIANSKVQIDLQDGKVYWLVATLEAGTGDANGMIVSWDAGNISQVGGVHTAKVYDGGNWHSWMQKIAEPGAGGVGASYGAYTRDGGLIGPDSWGVDWWIGAKPVFEVEFDSDWITLKHGRDYITERASTKIDFSAASLPNQTDGISYDNKTRYTSGDSKFRVARFTYSTGSLALDNAFTYIATDFMRDLVEVVDVDTVSTWTCGDWQITDKKVLDVLQSLCSLDRVSMRIYKNNLAHPRVTFEVTDKMITTDYTDYTTTEQALRTFRSGANCSDMRERAESARIVSANKSYNNDDRITRIFIRGGDDEIEIIGVMTQWDDPEYTSYGIIREHTMSSAIILSQDDAMAVADEVLNDYNEAPFDGSIVIQDARYDSYKLYNDTNGLVRVIISELDLDDWFEIETITTVWDGGSNWVNTIKLGDKTGKYRVVDLEGWERKFYRGLPIDDGVLGKIPELSLKGGIEDVAPGRGCTWYKAWKPDKSPGVDIEEEDLPTERYGHKYIIVKDLTNEPDMSGSLYMDIGVSTNNPGSSDIQSSIRNGDRPLIKKITSSYNGWTTYFAIFDKGVLEMDKESDFPKTIREVAIYDAADAGNSLTRAILKTVAVATTGYARNILGGYENYHQPIIFSSTDRIYVFFDVIPQ